MFLDLAQAAAQVTQPVVDHGDIVAKTVTQIPLAIAIVKGIEWVKSLNLPGLRWLSHDSSRGLLQFVNTAAAFLATAGITGTFEYAATGDAIIRLHGLADVGSKLFSFVAQLGFQQHFYDVTQLRKLSVTTHNVVMGTQGAPATEVTPEKKD